MSFFKKKKGNLLSDPEDAQSARSHNSHQQQQHRGQPAPSPSPTNSDPSASPSAPLLSSSQRRGTANYQPEPMMQYSAVGGDGAIGGLDWAEEEQQAPLSNDPAATLSGAPASSSAPVDAPTPSPEIVVPTLGQVDQLTEAQEASIRHAQHQQATAIHGYEPTPIEAVVDTETEWNDHTFVRTRSTVEQSMLPPPRHMSTSSSAGMVMAPSAAAPTPLLSSKLSPVHSRASSSDAASIPGHRGSTISAFGALAPAGAGAHSAAMVPGHAAASHRGSNPGSRRGSLSGDTLHAGEGLAQHSRRKSSAGPATPVLGAAPSPAAVPASPATIAAVSTPGPSASPAPAAAVVAVVSSPHSAQQPQPAVAGAGLASGSDSQQLVSSVGGAPAGSNTQQPPAPAARATSLQLAPSSGIPRDLPGGSSGAATLVNPRPFPKGLVRPSLHGPAASMSWAIGRAAGEEVKRVVKKDGSGGHSNSNASPGYTAYMNAINEATAAQAAGVAVGAAAVGAGVAVAASSSSSSSADAPPPRRSVVAAANTGPPAAVLKPGPPLPPRTHARQRTSSSVSDLRRSSDSQLDHMESEHGTTEEDLIPLSPSVHLLMSAYLLLYMSLASLLPAWIAMLAPLALYAAVGRMWPALHQITHHRKPKVHQMEIKTRSRSGGGGGNHLHTSSGSGTGANPALVAAAQSLPKPAEPAK